MGIGRDPNQTIREIARVEAERRRPRIEQMLLRGLVNRYSMARAFNVSYGVIQEDIRVIREEWLKNHSQDAIENACLRTRQIENVAILALESYERSRQDEIETTTVEKACDNVGCRHGLIKDTLAGKNIECKKCLGTGMITVETKKVKGQAGDASFLNTARACFVECARIEGIYDPRVPEGKFRKELNEILPDGTIRQKVEELYIDEYPQDRVIAALAMLDDLRHRQKLIEAKRASTIDAQAKHVEEPPDAGDAGVD